MNLKTSADAMNVQANLRADELDEIIMRDFAKPTKMWSKSPTSKFVTSFAGGLIKSVADRTSLYRVIRVGKDSFQVEYIGDRDNNGSSDEFHFDEHLGGFTQEEVDSDCDLPGVPIPRFCPL